MVKKAENTDAMAWGDYAFKITSGNMVNLSTLCKYAQMLDYITHAQGEDQLSIDGVVNEILYTALSKRVKELAHKHGYMSADSFINDLAMCDDGEAVAEAVKRAENEAYIAAHDRILEHIPLDDNQMKLPGIDIICHTNEK